MAIGYGKTLPEVALAMRLSKSSGRTKVTSAYVKAKVLDLVKSSRDYGFDISGNGPLSRAS